MISLDLGTTGRPKGVGISHAALIIQSLAKIATVGYDDDDVYLHTAPLCHIGGISSCIAILMAGACHVILPKFDVKSSFQAIEQHHVTLFIIVPAMITDLTLFARKSNETIGVETVKRILNGGGGLSDELICAATRVFPRAKIVSAYEQGVYVGKPAPHVELRINGSQNSSGPISIGSVLTRGMHVMVGYWNTTAASISGSVENGWLDTGDIGWLDCNGGLWLIGRKMGRIKSGGENVYPEEVGDVLSQHPGVFDVVMVGIPDIRLTEMVVACVSVRGG